MSWLTRTVANPLVCLLLASPAHRVISGALIKLSYTGRSTGKHRSMPVQYAADEPTLVVIASRASQKQWWRNFRQPTPLTVTLNGRNHPATGRILSGDDRQVALATYRRRFSRLSDDPDIQVLRITLDS